MALVPAVMTLMGKAAWYLPSWLDKLLPNIDIEGTTTIQTEVDERYKNNKKRKFQHGKDRQSS